MKQVETTAKKLDDAIQEGLKILGVSFAEVNVEVLDQGGFFRKAKVRLTVEGGEDEKPEVKPEVKPEPKKEEKSEKLEKKEKHEEKREVKPEQKKQEAKPEVKKEQHKEKRPPADTRPAPVAPMDKGEAKPQREPRKVSDAQVKLAEDYLGKLLELMKIDARIEVDTSHGNIDINLVTEDKTVIGHRGEVLDAMQILTKRAVEEGDDKFIHVNIDSHEYRIKREEALVALAERMAAKCVKTGRKVVLEPMNNTHRKVIHATLSSNDKVITRSEGKEPNRKVVIIPKR